MSGLVRAFLGAVLLAFVGLAVTAVPVAPELDAVASTAPDGDVPETPDGSEEQPDDDPNARGVYVARWSPLIGLRLTATDHPSSPVLRDEAERLLRPPRG